MAGPRPTRGTYPDETGPPADDVDRPDRVGRAALRYAERFDQLTTTDRLHPAVAAVLADDHVRAAVRYGRSATRLRAVE